MGLAWMVRMLALLAAQRCAESVSGVLSREQSLSGYLKRRKRLVLRWGEGHGIGEQCIGGPKRKVDTTRLEPACPEG
jgi:hypothetical protein